MNRRRGIAREVQNGACRLHAASGARPAEYGARVDRILHLPPPSRRSVHWYIQFHSAKLGSRQTHSQVPGCRYVALSVASFADCFISNTSPASHIGLLRVPAGRRAFGAQAWLVKLDSWEVFLHIPVPTRHFQEQTHLVKMMVWLWSRPWSRTVKPLLRSRESIVYRMRQARQLTHLHH